MAKKAEDSAVIRCIREVWRTTVHSWDRFNHRVRAALYLCAEGWEWEEGDLGKLFKTFPEIGRCFNVDDYEGLYAEAIRYGNLSYCLEHERHYGRQPIIVDDVSHGGRWNATTARKRDRICVGSCFEWKDERVVVTSFTKDGLAVACSYQVVQQPEDCHKCGCRIRSRKEKLLHRYTISAEAVKADRKKRKES